MIRRLLIGGALLAMPIAAQAAPLFSLEAAGALIFRADPQGSLNDEEPAWGARFGVALGEALALPAPLLLDAGLLWYGSSLTGGTDAMQVNRGLNTFALPVRAGWTLDWRPWDALQLAPYVTGGGALTRTDVTYRTADPVARRQGLDMQEVGVAGWQAGGIYGAGLAIAGPASGISIVGRLELLRLHRGPSADLALGVGLGAAF